MKWAKKIKRQFQKIHWKKTVGISVKDKTKFCIEFVSNPLSQETFEDIAGKYLKQVFGEQDDSKGFEVGFSYSLPGEVLVQAQKQLMLGLPKISISGKRILSKELVLVKYVLTGEGWIITQEIKGILR